MKTMAFVFDGLGEGGIERVGIDYIKLCKKLGYNIDVYNLNPSQMLSEKKLPEDVKVYHKKFPKELCPEIFSYGIQKWWWGKYAYVLISPIITILQGLIKLFSKKRKYDVAVAMAGHINDISFVGKNFIKGKKKIAWCHGTIISYLAICDAYSILYKKIDKFVVLSGADQKDIYAGRQYLYSKIIQKMYNPTFFSADKCNKEHVEELKKLYGDFTVMVARFSKEKNHETAIKTIKALKERGIDKKFVFIGSGVELEKIKQLAVKEGVEENCIFTGHRDDVQDYIAASYINLLTSKWEGLPTVIVEAMTLGKPCVMTNSDDGEVSGNGKYCILTEVENVEQLAEALYQLYTDKNVYKKYQESALERAKAFTPEKIQEELKVLLEAD